MVIDFLGHHRELLLSLEDSHAWEVLVRDFDTDWTEVRLGR